jgi:cell division protein FtsB
VAVQNQVVEDMRGQARQATQQYETLHARATDLEQRNGELERLLAGATATAQSQADMVKELLARISQQAPSGKPKGKVAAAG